MKILKPSQWPWGLILAIAKLVALVVAITVSVTAFVLALSWRPQ